MEQGTPPSVWGSAGSSPVASRTWGTLRPCSLTVPVEWPAGLGAPQGSCPEPRHRAGGPRLGIWDVFFWAVCTLRQSLSPSVTSGQTLLLGGGGRETPSILTHRKAPGTSLNECRAPVSQTQAVSLPRAERLLCAVQPSLR